MRLDRFLVYRDVLPGKTRAFTDTFYLLPDAPVLAVEPDGRPAFDFVWYRGEAGTQVAGGAVTMTVELGPTAAERDRLAESIVAALPAEHLPSVRLLAVPFTSGTVEISFAADRDGEFARTGPMPASLQAGQRATFVIELSKDGAALLAQALATGGELFHAHYELSFEHRLDGVTLRVWCDGARAVELAGQAGAGTADQLARTLTDQRSAGVELVESWPLPATYRSIVDDVGRRLLTAALSRTVLAGARDPGAVELALNHTFTDSFPVRQDSVHDAVITIGKPAEELGDAIRAIELRHGFFTDIDIPIMCTIDFSSGVVDLVHVVVEYDETGPSGRVRRIGEFIFREGVGTQRFRTELAAPDRRTLRWSAEVYYTGEATPLRIQYPHAPAGAIVLDLDATGVLDLAVSLRDVPLDLVGSATVELEHPDTGHRAVLVLDRERPAQRWTQVVRRQPGPIRYRVSWHAADGTTTVADWVATTARQLAMDAPVSVWRRGDIELVAAGDFSALAQLVVELRVTPTGQAEQFSFTAPGQQQRWAPTGLDPAAPRYQSRQVLVFPDGSRDELGWVDRDSPVLVVGDLLRFEVTVEPRLLDLGGVVRLAVLELAPEGGEPTTLVLRDPDTRRWSFRIATPGRHDYRYRLTLVPAAGERIVTPWQTGAAGILVLQSPSGRS